jgi:arylformamidase
MPVYDATLVLREGMLIYPGDPAFRMESLLSRKKGDSCNLALMSIGTHLGTHVDAPAHYVDGGATVDQIPLEALMGHGIVLDMRGKTAIDRKALEGSDLKDQTRLLFKTGNGPKLLLPEFCEEYVHVTEDAAQFLVERGVRLVGIDYLSIERYGNPGNPVHRTLLKAGILVVEGVYLEEIPPGPCEIYCLPLRIHGADGSPARIIIKQD